jgi:DNA-binding NarL/FixJ family response regulator
VRKGKPASPTPTAARSAEPAAGVILVEPLNIVREALGMFIHTQPDLDVVASTGTVEETVSVLAKIRSRVPLVALIAVELDDGAHDAFWLIHELRERYPHVRIAATGTAPDRMAISRALFVGADAFIDKRSNPIQFLDGLRRTLMGEMVLAGVPHDWLGPIAGGVEDVSEVSLSLTLREREVLSVAAEGLRAREMAERLGVTERTVTTHLTRIYEKLGVNNRMSAVASAMRSGLVSVRGVPGERAQVV